MTKDGQPLVSIIIPVYNIEDYLPACLDSIVHQTYKNLEIIVVDDGSTDDSNKIAKAYAAKDKRIVVLKKENGGQADARNFGYSKSKGAYIAFVDGDDYISKHYIETLMNAIIDNNSEISACQYRITRTTSDQSLETKPNNASNTVNNEDALKMLFYQKGISTAPWGKIFKREVWDGISFPKGKIYEDLATTYKVIAKANKVTICAAPLYYYMQRENSTMGKVLRPQRLDGLEFAEEAVDFTKKYYPNLEKAAASRVFMEAVNIMEEIKLSKNKTMANKVWAYVKKYRSAVKGNKEAKKNMRAYARVSYLGKQALYTALDAKERYGELSARRLQK